MEVNNTINSMYMDRIYKLIDPNTKEIRYIGRTEKKLYQRLAAHVGQVGRKNNNTDHIKWIRSLLINNQIPIIKLVKKVKTKSEGLDIENSLIKKYTELGLNLTNLNGGGTGSLKAQELFKRGKKHPVAKPIIGTHILTGKERYFYSQQHAVEVIRSEGTKICQRNISKCLRKARSNSKCKAIRKTAGGYKWEYNKNPKYL